MFSRFERQRGQSGEEGWQAAERGRGEQGSGANRGRPVKCIKVKKLELNMLGNKERAREKVFADVFKRESLCRCVLDGMKRGQKAESHWKLLIQICSFIYKIPIA